MLKGRLYKNINKKHFFLTGYAFSKLQFNFVWPIISYILFNKYYIPSYTSAQSLVFSMFCVGLFNTYSVDKWCQCKSAAYNVF